MKRIMLVLAALAVMGFVFAGCKKDKPPQDQPPPPADEAKKPEPPPDEAKKPEPPPDEAKKEEGAGGDEKVTGIPECDDFLNKYESCVNGKVPEAARGAMAKSIQMWKDGWKKLADNPATKKVLADTCKKTAEASKKAMASFKCEW